MNTLFYAAAWVLSTFAVAYGFGSIPFGLIIARVGGIGDIRTMGSGNIGATNVLRSGNKTLGFATLLFDAGKGMAAIMIVRSLYYSDLVYFAGLFAVLGHIFPVWLRFKGGKGVATAIGVLLALNWTLGICVVAVWLAAFLVSRMAAFASIACMWAAPIAALLLDGDAGVILTLNFAMLITFTHRANIERMLNGTESSFRKKKAAS